MPFFNLSGGVSSGSSLLVGWEAPAMNNNGTNYYFQVNHHLHITGIQADCSFSTLTNISGFSEVFAYGILLDAAPVIPTQNNPQGFFTIPGADGNFTNGTNLPASPGFHGGDVFKGGLFGFILKEWMPRGSNKTIFVPLDIEAKSGNWIIFHADHIGAGPIDFEMQTIITYELVN